MLVVGGHGQNKSLWNQDPFPQGLGIFDLTDLAWSKDGNYDAEAWDYMAPKLVEDWYKDRNLSDLSWSSDEVKSMFVKNPILFNAMPSSTATASTHPAKPSSTATARPNSTTSDEQSPASNVGPIAGGVIGGVAILGTLAGLAYYIWRKRSRPSRLEKESNQSGASEHSPSLKPRNELSADGQITELDVLPGELASNSEAWELDASNQPQELDAYAPARGIVRD